MDPSPDSQPDRAQCERSARHVLREYRERRRTRRGADTFFGSAEALLEHVERGIEPTELEHRRDYLLREAEAAGMSVELAELAYDVAREEGLDPALGFELVRSGLGVCPPEDGISNASEAPATDKYLPAWIFPPSPPDRVLRERTLHVSFRRLRALLEEYHDIEEAFRLFANEPDVGHCGY